MDESGTDEAVCRSKVASGRRVAGTIRSLVNGRVLQLDFVTVLHETLLVPVLMYGSETMIWKEKERSRIRAVLRDNLRGLLVIRRMDRVPNKGVLQSDEGVVQMEGLMRVFSGGLAMWREWRMIGLVRRSM